MRASRVTIARASAALALAPMLCLLVACDENRARRGTYSGTIEAVEVDVVPEVAGKLIERKVDQGDEVAAGDVIARIDPEPYRLALLETDAAIQKARAQADLLVSGYRPEEVQQAVQDVQEAEARQVQAASRLQRVIDLVAQQVGTQDDLEVAHRDLDTARARVASLKQRLSLLQSGYRTEEVASARAELARLAASTLSAKSRAR